MRFPITAAAILMAFAAPSMALAASEPIKSAPAVTVAADHSEAGLARRREVTRQILEVIHFNKTIHDTLDAAMPVIVERYFPRLSEHERREMANLVTEAVEDLLTDYADRVTDIYVELFTERELQAMLTFYSTPEGQAINAKTPLLSVREQELISELGPQVTEALRARGCAKFGCGKDEPRT